jgi:nucleotide-binding universal stress UspA family protein
MVRIRQILVPTDFSEPAEAAWQYAKDLAQEFQSGLHLLHVVPEPYVYPWGTELSTLPLAELLNQAEAAAKQRLAELVSGVAGPAARVDFGTAIGPPVDRILDYAGTHQIDLIVMGTHGRGTVGHLLLGSVVERVIRRATVPVLTVHGAPGRATGPH